MQLWIGFYTLIKHEVSRFFRIWRETLLPPLITTALYFTIFGTLIGVQIQHIQHFSYMQFITPGLIMMSVVTNSFINTVTSVYLLRFQKAIEEILVSPMPHIIILTGFVLGGVIRGMLTGILVMLLSLFYSHMVIQHIGFMFLTLLLTSILFSLAGFLNGMLAKSFDDIGFMPTFILTPLTYLGGVFYSIQMLPAFWQKISLLNPILYLVNAFRYSLLGVTDIAFTNALWMLTVLIIALIIINYFLLSKGVGMRT